MLIMIISLIDLGRRETRKHNVHHNVCNDQEKALITKVTWINKSLSEWYTTFSSIQCLIIYTALAKKSTYIGLAQESEKARRGWWGRALTLIAVSFWIAVRNKLFWFSVTFVTVRFKTHISCPILCLVDRQRSQNKVSETGNSFYWEHK